MSTKSSPGWSAHERTRELCTQCSAPATLPELFSRGYWNSPAAHTTYRAVSLSLARDCLRGTGASPRGLLRTPTLKSGALNMSSPTASTEMTSVSVRTCSFAPRTRAER